LRDDDRQPLGGTVNDGVPRDQTTQRVVRKRQFFQGADLEVQLGIGASRDIDHARGQVDADHVQPSRDQMGADAACPTAGVSDRTEPGTGAPVCKPVDHCDVEARLCVQCWQKSGVGDGDGVIALLRLLTVVRDGHERKG
jgi:hypothetical protein